MTATLPLLALLTVGPVAPTSAATARVADRADQRYPATADVLGLGVDNGPRVFRATITMRELSAQGTTAYVYASRPGGDTPDYVVGTRSTRTGHRPTMIRIGSTGDEAVRCPGLRVGLDTAADVVRIRFPQSCLGEDAGTQVVAALSEAGRGDTSDVDSTRTLKVTRG